MPAPGRPPTACAGASRGSGCPRGRGGTSMPGRLVAERLGLAHADTVHTVMADVGVVQQDLLSAAAERIAAGELDVALVVGGEAKYRQLRGTILVTRRRETAQPDGTEPDERWRPESLAVLDLEIVRNTVTPVAAYALIERAIGHALGELDGRTEDEHRDRVAELWARFAAVAAANPRAWDRSGPATSEIRDAGPGNRMISFPYTKRLAAQWNVDQAAAIVLCSAEVAADVGVARDRWVFPHASTVSNLARSVTERREVHRSLGAEVAAPRVLELAGIARQDLGPVDVYSCFPSAVQLLAARARAARSTTPTAPSRSPAASPSAAGRSTTTCCRPWSRWSSCCGPIRRDRACPAASAASS